MWKKTIKDLPAEKVISMKQLSLTQFIPLLCSYIDDRDEENIVHLCRISEITADDVSHMKNISIYQNEKNT